MKKRIEKIIKTGISRISISIDEINNTDYSKKESFVHIESEKVIENVKNLIYKKGNKKFPIIILQPVIQKGGIKKLEGLIDFASEFGIKEIHPIRIDNQLNTVERPSWEEEHLILQTIKKYGRKKNVKVKCVNDQNFIIRIAGHFDKFCLKLDNTVYITVDGKITPCCILREYILGDVTEKPIVQIWQGHKMREFRKTKSKTICKKCDALKYYYYQ